MNNSAEVERAERLQAEMAGKVVRHDAFGPVKRVAGVDVAYSSDGLQAVAAAALLDARTLEPIETAVAVQRVAFVYRPGLFSFRELPPIEAALAGLTHRPDLVVCDGHGIAHPRRFGLASHLGVTTGLPTIGCAKTRLIGVHAPPPPERGASAPLVDSGEVIGVVLRTKDNTRPVYVSVGHRVSLPTACEWILQLTPRFRLPETTRAADHAVRVGLRKLEGPSPTGL